MGVFTHPPRVKMSLHDSLRWSPAGARLAYVHGPIVGGSPSCAWAGRGGPRGEVPMGVLRVAAVAALAAVLGCTKQSSSSGAGGDRGVAEHTFKLTVQNGQDGNASL